MNLAGKNQMDGNRMCQHGDPSVKSFNKLYCGPKLQGGDLTMVGGILFCFVSVNGKLSLGVVRGGMG